MRHFGCSNSLWEHSSCHFLSAPVCNLHPTVPRATTITARGSSKPWRALAAAVEVEARRSRQVLRAQDGERMKTSSLFGECRTGNIQSVAKALTRWRAGAAGETPRELAAGGGAAGRWRFWPVYHGLSSPRWLTLRASADRGDPVLHLRRNAGFL